MALHEADSVYRQRIQCRLGTVRVVRGIASLRLKVPFTARMDAAPAKRYALTTILMSAGLPK